MQKYSSYFKTTFPVPKEIDRRLAFDNAQRTVQIESQFRELEPTEFDYGAEVEAVFKAQEALFDSMSLGQ